MNHSVNFEIHVDEISFKNNNIASGTFNISPTITRSTGVNEDGKYFTKVNVELLNSDEAPFPVDIRVSMTGLFDLNDVPEEDRIDFLNHNGFDAIYPYIRSTITNLSTNAMLPPIIIPIVDAHQAFQEA